MSIFDGAILQLHCPYSPVYDVEWPSMVSSLNSWVARGNDLLFEDALPSIGFPAIAQLPWIGDPVAARRQAYDLLSHGTDIGAELYAWLRGLDPSETDLVVRLSLERSSHYKWFLGGNIHDYFVWLHQYKSPGEFNATNEFAASIHDHRLWFCSRVMSGGLYATWYKAVLDGEKAQLTPTMRQHLRPGMVFQMHSDEIHGIESVEEGTVTLLIQGPPERHYSTSYDPSDGSSRQNFDLEALYPQFLSALKDSF
jgi:hypothetical protein